MLKDEVLFAAENPVASATDVATEGNRRSAGY
jgi:hypothetical protein